MIYESPSKLCKLLLGFYTFVTEKNLYHSLAFSTSICALSKNQKAKTLYLFLPPLNPIVTSDRPGLNSLAALARAFAPLSNTPPRSFVTAFNVLMILSINIQKEYFSRSIHSNSFPSLFNCFDLSQKNLIFRVLFSIKLFNVLPV